jgi:hypothetical protein
MNTMSNNAANNAGRQAASHAYFAQRNARFIDPWKIAAGKIAQARLAGSFDWGNLGQRRQGPAPALNPLAERVLRGIAKRTVGEKGKPGPSQAREDQRYHTPQEYQPQFIEDQLNTERSQTQPGERQIGHSPWGNLSETQFLGEQRPTLGGLGDIT